LQKTQYQTGVSWRLWAAVEARNFCFHRSVCRRVSMLLDLSSKGSSLLVSGSDLYFYRNFRDLSDLPLSMPRFLPEYMLWPSF